MIDIGLGEWSKEYDGYMLMKFTGTYEFQQCFLDGKLFFNTSDFFAKCEDRGRGDGDEGKTFVMNPNNQGYVSANLEQVGGTYMIVVRDYSNNPQDYKPGTIFDYSEAKNRNRKVISFYTVYLNIEKQIVDPFPENMPDEFGKFAVLITDRHEFFERVNAAIKKIENCREATMGFVEYQDLKEGLNDWHPFRKDISKFGYQNEFRITFVNNNSNTYMLNLGCSLRDIAAPIMASDVKKIKFVDGKLIYPMYSSLHDIYYKIQSTIKKRIQKMKK